MDDLSGLDWSATSDPKPYITSTGVKIQPLRQSSHATLSSAGLTHASIPVSGSNKIPTPVPKAPPTDSFSNLVSFGSSKQVTLTLQEQQEKLQAEKATREAERNRQYEVQFGNSQFWDGLGAENPTVHTTPQITIRASTLASQAESQLSDGSIQMPGGANSGADREDDIFAAFNADTKVDNSSYYPPTGGPKSRPLNPLNSIIWASDLAADSDNPSDDDDPFGMGQMKTQGQAFSNGYSPADGDSDNLLGDLAKPVEEIKRKIESSSSVETLQQEQQETNENLEDPWDKAVNDLVDMGFSAEKSRQALVESGGGLDVQAAVGWLLNDAHRQAKEKAQHRSEIFPENSGGSRSSNKERQRSSDRSRGEPIPPWMRQESNSLQPRSRDGSRSPAYSDVDISKTAAAVGSNILKTANSLWKSSQKKVQRAVAEFSQDPDPDHPKWMSKNPYKLENEHRNQDKKHAVSDNAPIITDEAMLLEMDSRPLPRHKKPAPDPRSLATGSASPYEQSPVSSNPLLAHSTSNALSQPSTLPTSIESRSRLSKHATEEQSSQAYVSPARRKKTTTSKMAAESNLLGVSDFNDQPFNYHNPPKPRATENKFQFPQTSKPPIPTLPRPEPPLRNVPSLSTSALATTTKNRLSGTEHFKRGDYASAHSSYSSSLSALPPSHPIAIVLLCNRSLTALKTGDPKSAIADADVALTLIGSGRGEGELIDLEDGSHGCKKPMKEFWCKALMRKAEALEQMERWKDAGIVWKEAVEAGVGGVISIQGRQRCEKAVAPKPAPKNTPKPSGLLPKPRFSALNDLSPLPVKETEAVSRLREANIAAEKADDEKFALSDSVDARISKWRDGRKDNLRALLGGMDQVLWEGSGWKKVGMHELVVNGKVKITYMKAISKVHPDKLPQDASVEMKMISASVFASLNEAWDKFKAENGM